MFPNPVTLSPPLLRRVGVAVLCCLALAPARAAAAGAAPPAESPAPAWEYRLPEDTAELLRLDDGMRAFFAARVGRNASVEKRLDQISAAILGEDGLHFRYDARGTYDVREAFRRRSGNCVTFSLLVVAVAREYRLPAQFNEVVVRRRWSRAGEFVLESRHLNVWVEIGTNGYEIDLQLRDDLRASRFYSQPVPDERAFAGLYGNDGIFRLAAGRAEEALRSLRRATEIDPSHSSAWVNLGNAYLFRGDHAAARDCFERGLALDSSAEAAVCGLAYIHRAAGRDAEAEPYERAAQRHRERNPYHLFARGREALAAGRAEEARRLLARAIRIKRDEPEFYTEMVSALRVLGRERDARRWARRAAALPVPPVVAMR